MKNEELLEVLIRINNEKDEKIDEKIIERVLAVVMRNPLEEDRSRSQDQIVEIIKHKIL
jgi:hypothetical protein